MQLPTYEEIEALHRTYAPSQVAFTIVFTHCTIVRDIALQLVDDNQLDVDRDLVTVGCLLHDIGVYSLVNADGSKKEGVDYFTHGIVGEKLLKEAGYSEQLARFASHHTGVGISKADIEERGLPLPPADYQADSPEELLVMYADKFHSKTDPCFFNSFEFYQDHVSQFGSDNVPKFNAMAEQFGKPRLDELSKKYGHKIRTLGD